jgi:hypothetical protein
MVSMMVDRLQPIGAHTSTLRVLDAKSTRRCQLSADVMSGAAGASPLNRDGVVDVLSKNV